ncbi:hypothetical protein Tco_0018866 [Tanacetum coccineum]
MWNLRRIMELQASAHSTTWSDVLSLYFWRAKEADRRLACMINNMCVKLRAAIEEYQLFTQELEASPGWVVNKVTMEMHMHPEQHTVNSAALFHEVPNEMEKLDLE